MHYLRSMLAVIILASTVLATAEVGGPIVRAEGVAPAAVEENQAAYRADLTALAAEIDATGRAPLIVGLNAPGYDPAMFDQVHAAGAQEASIATAQQALLDRMASYGVTGVKLYEYIPFVALTVDSHAALAALYADPEVTSIEEDALHAPMLAESIPLIQAPEAHSLFYTGAGKTIAILDSGVDKNHPALTGKVVSEACYSSDDLFGPLSPTCPNGATSSVAPNSGLPCPSNNTGCDHGTHVAHIAATVAPGANIIAIQVFSISRDRFLISSSCKDAAQTSPCIRTRTSDYLRGLNRVYALRNTYDIVAVNMSLGGGKYAGVCDSAESSTKTTVDLLRSAGIATVVATGNSGHVDGISKPACLSNVISVGSVNSATFIAPADLMAAHTNISPVTTLLAPGNQINAAIPLSYATNAASAFGRKSGTSMAAPHVAGAIAVLQQARPDKNVNTMATALATTGPQISDWRDGATVHNKRRLDVYGALCHLTNCDGDDFRTLFFEQTYTGRIHSPNDIDHFYIQGIAGQRVTIRMNTATGSLDPYLELFDPRGRRVALNDNGGGGVNALINGYLLEQTGRYMLVARNKTRTAVGPYTLSLSSRVEAVNPAPILSAFAPSSATAISTGQDFWMMINGSNFMPTTEVLWNGQRRSSLYYGPDLLYVRILGSDLNVQTSFTTIYALISVRNPGPGGGTANGFFQIRPAFLGESELVAPESGSVVTTGIKQTLVISWTHPTDSWRTMQYMDLRFRSPAGNTLASIRVVEQEGETSVYQLLNDAGSPLTEEDGETPSEGRGGDDRNMEIPGLLTLHLGESAFSGSGRTAIMTPTVTFGPEAVGVYNIEFRVDGPDGEVQDDDVLGQITITPADCPYPVTGLTLNGAETGVAGADYTYTANLEPINASQPLTLTWAPEPVSGQGTSTAVYNWSEAGEQFVFVSAENCGGFGADVKAMRIRTSETPDLAISKSGPGVAVAGEVITYTLTITNSGAETAANLVVLDELPPDAAHVSGGTVVGNSVRWDIPELAGYGAVTQTTVSVIANATLTNTNYSVSAQGGYSASGEQPITTQLVRAKSTSDPLSDASLYITDSSGPRVIDIAIPAGSVFEETTFTLDELAQPGYALPEGLSYAGRAFRLGAYQQNQPAASLELGEALSLTVAYDAADAATAHNGVVGLYQWDGSQWTQEGLTCVTQSEQQQLACVYSGQRLTQFTLAVAEITDEQPVAGVALTASTASATAEVGAQVEYRLTLTNMGNAADSFTVTVNSSWSASTSTGDIGPLAAGASTEFNVTVTVPAEAGDGEGNVATVSVVSQADGGVQAQAALTTTAQRLPGDDNPNDDDPADQTHRVLLPAILSQGGSGIRAQISAVEVEGGRFVIHFTTSGYAPALPGQHVHFFFNTTSPEQAGAPGNGAWHVHGSLSEYRGVTLAERPAGATQLCVLVANPDHSVLLGSGNCYNLP
ncbi:MAG: S8 family serine peptidase [Caldilineaceae bacterium]|nr:S8 family serine peptidase [Caldilineaceae bacterium]